MTYDEFCIFKMTSIERIVEYTDLPNENQNPDIQKPPENWPIEGEIKFENLSMKYAANLQNVLNNISLVISPCQKIGIIGRYD